MIKRLLAALCLLSLAVTAAGEPPRPDPAAPLRGEEQLAAEVTLAAKHRPLGELLADLGRHSTSTCAPASPWRGRRAGSAQGPPAFHLKMVRLRSS